MTNEHDHHAHHHHDDERHGHDHPGGLRGALQAVFRPHSHDAADSMDSALAASERGIRAVRRSFVALLLTSLAQLAVVVLTGSIALLADTIHNFSDALTAVPLFLAFRISRRPSNRRFTYGYGRAEDLAGMFVIAMIAVSAVVAGWEAIDRLIHPRAISGVWILFAAGLIGFFGNELVALYRIREGNAIGSAALVADGYHARTDGFTSLAVSIGAVGVAAGFKRADPIVGLIISIAIFAVLKNAARQIYERLMDAVDPRLPAEIEHQAAHVDGVRGVSDVQVRWLGHRLGADLVIDVDPTLSVEQGHDVATAVSARLRTQISHLDTARVHVHPVPSAR